MSIYNLQITEPAEKDLYEIGTYIFKEIITLEDMPLRNALVIDDRLAYKGIRKFLVDNYIVFYIITEESNIVTIIRILYNKRDWLKLL